jgi:hypothetical protein
MFSLFCNETLIVESDKNPRGIGILDVPRKNPRSHIKFARATRSKIASSIA